MKFFLRNQIVECIYVFFDSRQNGSWNVLSCVVFCTTKMVYMVLEIKPKTCVLGKHSTKWATPASPLNPNLVLADTV